jgi:MscS family membrane protein
VRWSPISARFAVGAVARRPRRPGDLAWLRRAGHASPGLVLAPTLPVRSIDVTIAIEIAGALIAAIVVARLISHATGAVVCRVLRRRHDDADAEQRRAAASQHLRGPLTLALAIGLWQLALSFVDLGRDLRATLHDVARAGLVIALAWLTLRLIDLGAGLLERRTRVFAHHEMSHALLPLGRRVAKVVIAAVAMVALLGSLGYSVTGLVAGLGITGIAVALAAQKTLENVLGAFALGIDQPLREGDLVKVDQTVGTVERIGLRSTRLRTADRTLVAYPNGKLADSVIERYSARDRMRFHVRLRLGLATTGPQLRELRDRIEALLTEHPARAGDSPSVHLAGPGDAWFELEAMAWFDAPSWAEFQTLQDQLLLACLDVVAQVGAALHGAPPPAPAQPAPPADAAPARSSRPAIARPG